MHCWGWNEWIQTLSSMALTQPSAQPSLNDIFSLHVAMQSGQQFYLFVVDLRTLKEVRIKEPDDREIKEFEKWSGEVDNGLCLSIHYGVEFVLKHLALQGISRCQGHQLKVIGGSIEV